MSHEKNNHFVKPQKPLCVWLSLVLMMLTGLGLAYFFLVRLTADSIMNPINERDFRSAIVFFPIGLSILFFWFKTFAFLWEGRVGSRLVLFIFAFISAIPAIIGSCAGNAISLKALSPLLIMGIIIVLFFIPQSHRWFKDMDNYQKETDQNIAMSKIRIEYPNIDTCSANERFKILQKIMKEQKKLFKKEPKKSFWFSFLSAIGFVITCSIIKVLMGK